MFSLGHVYVGVSPIQLNGTCIRTDVCRTALEGGEAYYKGTRCFQRSCLRDTYNLYSLMLCGRISVITLAMGHQRKSSHINRYTGDHKPCSKKTADIPVNTHVRLKDSATLFQAYVSRMRYLNDAISSIAGS